MGWYLPLPRFCMLDKRWPMRLGKPILVTALYVIFWGDPGNPGLKGEPACVIEVEGTRAWKDVLYLFVNLHDGRM